jgi:hypothetical protein
MIFWWLLLVACIIFYVIINVRNLESHMHIAGRCALLFWRMSTIIIGSSCE